MNKEQFIKGITYLGMAYKKEFTQQELELYYDFLKDYDYETFRLTVIEIIKSNKYMPSISEIIEMCDESNTKRKYDIIEIMKKDNYFANNKEYDKAMNFLTTGIIPEWFKKDMKKYYQKQLEDKRLLLNE